MYYPMDLIERYLSRNGAVRTGRNARLFLTTALAEREKVLKTWPTIN
jgi:hypothetical protein